MKVSVLMLAYNHEKFIAWAINSVLMQQVNFDYEIVIGEDCSKDNTRNILIRYQQEYPDKIRLLLPEKNLGMHDNFNQTLKACQGRYVALLEGDDYWTSPAKLQKQVDFLEANIDCTICFHNALSFYPNGGKKCYLPPEDVKKEFTLEDLLSSNIMPTAAIMFRQGFVQKLPDWIYDLALGDWVLQVLLAQQGNIGYINEVLSVYRVHSQGHWSSKSILEINLELTKVLQYFIKYLNLDSKYQRKIRIRLSEYYSQFALFYEQNKNRKAANKYVMKVLLNEFLNPSLLSSNFSLKASVILQIYTPILYKIFKRFKYRLFATFGNLVKAEGRGQI